MMVGLTARQIVRRAVDAPIQFTSRSIIQHSNKDPIIAGEYGGWYTKGGTPIMYPSAYSKKGWSNMNYQYSTRKAKVHRKWLIRELDRKKLPTSSFAGVQFYCKNYKKFRRVERFLSKVEPHIERAPEDKKDKLIETALKLVQKDTEYIDFQFGKFPLPTIKECLSFLGFSPKEAAKIYYKVDMTRAEAKEWFTSPQDCPKHWMKVRLEKCWAERWIRNNLNKSDLSVLRWLMVIATDGEKLRCIEKSRKIRGPHQEELTFRFIDRIDEIKPCDLIKGEYSGVVSTFERASKRIQKEIETKLKNDHKILAPDPYWWPGDTDQYRILRTAAELVAEGYDLDTCVGTYAPYVKRKKSVIVSIHDHTGFRSTVEFSYDQGRVLQHRAYGNSIPKDDECELILNKLCDNIKNIQEKHFAHLELKMAV